MAIHPRQSAAAVRDFGPGSPPSPEHLFDQAGLTDTGLPVQEDHPFPPGPGSGEGLFEAFELRGAADQGRNRWCGARSRARDVHGRKNPRLTSPGDRVPESRRRGVGIDTEFLPKHLAAGQVLGESGRAIPGLAVGEHQPAVEAFLQGVDGQGLPGMADHGAPISCGFLVLDQAGEGFQGALIPEPSLLTQPPFVALADRKVRPLEERTTYQRHSRGQGFNAPGPGFNQAPGQLEKSLGIEEHARVGIPLQKLPVNPERPDGERLAQISTPS